MKEVKWSQKLLIVLGLIVFSPLIIVSAIIIGVMLPFQIPKSRKEYKNSSYYADLRQKFKMSILDSPEYRFYNSAVRRNLLMKYIKQETNGFEYFIYNGTIYIFPDFDQIDLNEDKTTWQSDCDGDWRPFDECYKNLLTKLEDAPDLPVKLLVERKMFPALNLNGVDIPDCIFITWSYENAFENEDSPLKMIVPQNAGELYDMMLQTPNLCGDFKLDESSGTIIWNLHENIGIEIGVDPRDCCIGISKLHFGKVKSGITHWHSTIYEIYDEVCHIGKRGNVMVFRSSWCSGALLYSGSKDDCPYSPDKKSLFSKYYYLEAR